MRNLIRILFFLFVVRPFMVLFIGLRVYGKNNIPNKNPFVVVANHSSHLDAISLLSLFPLSELKDIRPVAAADYFEKNWVISSLAHTFFNILSISRHCASKHDNPLAYLEKAIALKQSLIFFPEGTRSLTGDMGSFHSGITHLTEKHLDLPVVPVYLCNMGRSLPKGEFLPIPFFCDIKIGEAMFPKGDRKEQLEMIKNAILALKGAK